MKYPVTVIMIILISALSFAQFPIDRFDPLLGEVWYGIYMQDAKVGYASMALKKTGAEEWHFESNILMKLKMGESVMNLETQDFRIYGGPKAELISNRNISKGDMGAFIVSGQSDGQQYNLDIDIMGNKHTKTLQFPLETLDDYLAVQLKVINNELKVGERIEQVVFMPDPTILANLKHILIITGKDELRLGGLPTPVYTFIDSIPEMRVGGTSMIDLNGNLIRQDFPSMNMILKAETAEMAKDFDAAYDVIANNVISAPNGPKHPQEIKTAEYLVTGIDSKLLPENSYTRIIEKGNSGTIVSISNMRIDDFSATLPIKDASLAEFIKSESLIQSDNEEIMKLAGEIVGDTHNAYEAAKLINQWVYKKIKKQFSPDISNAIQTLKLRRGDCGEHAALTVALLRAAGIPARTVAGIAYVPSADGFGYHAWVEAYVGQWLQMDPTWGENLADATHIMLGRGSLKDMTASVMGSLGQLEIEILKAE